VVVIQEMFGINAFMREACRMFANAGYAVLCPDLYWRQRPGVSLTDASNDEIDQAFALFKDFDLAKGIDDLRASIDHLRKSPATTGRVGAVGYCLGGLLAYLLLCRTDADCAVGYYGVDIDRHLNEARKIARPLMLHVAENDSTMSPQSIAKVKDGLKGHACVTLHCYPALDHAFARFNTRYFKFDPKAAALANQRSLDFLERHLS
jgi:carboxymethylenebutenolidase